MNLSIDDEATEFVPSCNIEAKSKESARTKPISMDDEKLPTADVTENELPLHDDETIDLSAWARNIICKIDPTTLDTRQRGVVFDSVRVYGSGSMIKIQHTVLSALWYPMRRMAGLFIKQWGSGNNRHVILHDFDGLLQSGQMLLVLGRPGSGCSTFLKTLCGRLRGLSLDASCKIQYKGISYDKMRTQFRGDLVYNSETDEHFPHLTVGETLSFAAQARAPPLKTMSREQYVDVAVKIIMKVFGISHAYNCKVGDDNVRGLSGGERKRVR